MANNLAVHVKDLKAAVQLHYEGMDERVNEVIPKYEEALKKANINHEIYIYPKVQHAFHNDTSAARYNEPAARLAWQRTMVFLTNM